MNKVELHEKLVERYHSSKKFNGFSTESLHFFDDYPIDSNQSRNWWNNQKSNYEEFLKPEFFDLLEGLISVVSHFDEGLNTDVSQCLGRTHDMSTKPIPYRWAALHSEGSDKRIDVQFFINLTILAFAVLGMFIGGVRLVYITMVLEQLSPSLKIPLGVVYSVIPISGILIIFYKILDLKKQAHD